MFKQTYASCHRLAAKALAKSAPISQVARGSNSYIFRSYSTEAPPTILAQIKSEMKQAMREKQRVKLSVIKAVLSDIGYAEKAVQPFIEIKKDEDVAPLIQRAIKKRQDSIEQYKAGGREDLAATEVEEINILQSYLPKPYSEEEIEVELKRVIQELNATSSKDLGKVLKAVTLDPTKASKSAIASIAKKLLN